MKTNKRLIQIMLIVSGLFLIFSTYYFYPKMKEDKLAESVVKNEKKIVDKDKQSNVFEKVEYKGFYDFDNPFIILSDKAYILAEESNIVHMQKVKITLDMKDGRTVIITGDKGVYNKETYDCYVENNVKATDGETIINSENLDLISTKEAVSIYNNVKLITTSGSLVADKIDYNFEAKNYKISMFNDEKVKIKLVKWITLKNLEL